MADHLTPEQERALRPLTHKQRLFVLAFVRTGNALGACREAGYKQPVPQSHRNIKNEQCRAAVAALRKPQEQKQLVSRERSLARVESIAHRFGGSTDPKEAAVAIAAEKHLASLQGWNAPKRVDVNRTDVQLSIAMNLPRPAGYDALPAEGVVLEHEPHHALEAPAAPQDIAEPPAPHTEPHPSPEVAKLLGLDSVEEADEFLRSIDPRREASVRANATRRSRRRCSAAAPSSEEAQQSQAGPSDTPSDSRPGAAGGD